MAMRNFEVDFQMVHRFTGVRILRNFRLTSSQNENLMGVGEMVRQQGFAKD